MRCAIFVDGAYLSKVAHEFGGRQTLDYQKLTQLILPKGHDLLRVNYYDCHPYASKPPTADETWKRREKEKLFANISASPRHEVRLGQIVRRGEDGNHTYHQKLIDTMISVDIVEQATTRQVQTIVLVAGDSDFRPAIEAAKRQGVLTVLWSGPRHTVHEDLVALVDEHHILSEGALAKIRTAIKVDESVSGTRPKAARRTRNKKPTVTGTPPTQPTTPPSPATAEGLTKRRRRHRRPSPPAG